MEITFVQKAALVIAFVIAAVIISQFRFKRHD